MAARATRQPAKPHHNLTLRRRVAPSRRVGANQAGCPPFETRTACAPQGEASVRLGVNARLELPFGAEAEPESELDGRPYREADAS
jgi:hypothetical protein